MNECCSPALTILTGCIKPLVGLAGQYISFGSTHTWETGMQTYVVGVQTLAVAPPPPQPVAAVRQHIYCDLAVRLIAAAQRKSEVSGQVLCSTAEAG